jgi:hypothetical protein
VSIVFDETNLCLRTSQRPNSSRGFSPIRNALLRCRNTQCQSFSSTNLDVSVGKQAKGNKPSLRTLFVCLRFSENWILNARSLLRRFHGLGQTSDDPLRTILTHVTSQMQPDGRVVVQSQQYGFKKVIPEWRPPDRIFPRPQTVLLLFIWVCTRLSQNLLNFTNYDRQARGHNSGVFPNVFVIWSSKSCLEDSRSGDLDGRKRVAIDTERPHIEERVKYVRTIRC